MADKKYISKVLVDGETLISQFGYHWTRYLTPKYFMAQLVPLTAAVMVGGIAYPIFDTHIASLLFGFMAWLLLEWLVWMMITSDVRIVTNKRLILKEGFFSRKTSEIKLSAIEAIEFEQSIIERVLGVACLQITGLGGGSQIKFHHVNRPIATKHMIESIDWAGRSDGVVVTQG